MPSCNAAPLRKLTQECPLLARSPLRGARRSAAFCAQIFDLDGILEKAQSLCSTIVLRVSMTYAAHRMPQSKTSGRRGEVIRGEVACSEPEGAAHALFFPCTRGKDTQGRAAEIGRTPPFVCLPARAPTTNHIEIISRGSHSRLSADSQQCPRPRALCRAPPSNPSPDVNPPPWR